MLQLQAKKGDHATLTFSSFQIRKYTAPSICISHINHYTRVNNVHNSSLVLKYITVLSCG